MKKFVVIYHAPADSMAQTANATPEQRAEGMKAWMDWAGRVGQKLKDMGAPLMGGTRLHTDGSETASKNEVSGYSIIEAENMEEAKAMMANHPHTAGWNADAAIEIHETMPMPSM